MEEARKQMFRDSIHPINDHGLLDLVDVGADGLDIAPGITLVPTPGHTPGQVAVRLNSQGSTALITGDCIHHPVQLAEPDIHSHVDIDPAQAEATRRDLLTALADTDTLLLGSHFPRPRQASCAATAPATGSTPYPPGPYSTECQLAPAATSGTGADIRVERSATLRAVTTSRRPVRRRRLAAI